MATNGDLKRWYGDVPETKVSHDFVRYDDNGLVPHTTAKLYKHMVKFTNSGKTYHFTLVCTIPTKITTAGDIPWMSSIITCGDAAEESANDGVVIGTIAQQDGSRKLIGTFINNGTVTTTVVALTGEITDADPVALN